MSEFHGVAAEIAETIGEAAALSLMAERGGTEVKIPVRVKGSQLARIVGTEACQLMIAKFGPGRLLIPLGPARGQKGRRTAAMQMLREGKSVRDVARACDLHERSVWNFRATLRDRGQIGRDDSQGQLPFDS